MTYPSEIDRVMNGYLERKYRRKMRRRFLLIAGVAIIFICLVLFIRMLAWT